MAITTATGTAAACRASIASEGDSYAGVRYCTALLGSGYVGIFGGKTVDGAGTVVSIDLLTVFRITSQTVLGDGSRQLAYEWRRTSAPAVTAHLEDAQAVPLLDPFHDGQVLLLGGHLNLAGATANATVVTHRPASPGPEAFTAVPTAAMSVARAMHRAVALLTGRVLVSGGFTAWSTPLASAERWNPVTETWSAAGAMRVARMDHGQVLLPSGKVLVAGGRTSATTSTASCELYDPAGNAWATVGSMSCRRYGHQLVLLPSGMVLAVGGTGQDASSPAADVPLAQAELYDPATNAWRALSAAPTSRARPAAALLPSGLVAVAGGDATAVDLFDPVAGGWRRSVASLPRVRRDCQAVLLADFNAVLYPGGEEFVSSVWTTTEHSSILVAGAEALEGGRLDGPFRVAVVPSGTSVQVDTGVPAPASQGAGGTLTPLAGADAPYQGAHVVDRVGLAVTGTTASVGVLLARDQPHSVVTLQASGPDPEPALRFPDQEGWLAFRAGRQGQVGPVRYLGRLSVTDLRLDAATPFPNDVLPGDEVLLLSARDVAPPPDPSGGYAYLTAGTAGRVAASQLLDRVVAAGVPVERIVRYPGDAGLGAAGGPTSGADRISSIVACYAGDDVSAEVAAARKAGR